MFYCDSCAAERAWPTTLSRSRGSCEVCGKVAICNDRPSRLLPLPPGRELRAAAEELEGIARRLRRVRDG